MKKTDLVENVTAWTKGTAKNDVDENQLAMDLLKNGASMALVGRELGKALIALKLKDDPSVLRKEIETAVDAEMDDYTAICEMDYNDVTEFVNTVAEANEYEPQAVYKALKKQCKKLDIALPAKPKLGKVKQGIVDYFAANTETSIKGLAEFLYDNDCCNATKQDTEEEAALRAARMQYTFAVALMNV
jgi:hypothetical protein